MAGVRYPIEMVNGVPVVAAPEEIDASNADCLRAVLLEAAARGHETFVVDPDPHPVLRLGRCRSPGPGAQPRPGRRRRAAAGHAHQRLGFARVRAHWHRPGDPRLPQPVRSRDTSACRPTATAAAARQARDAHTPGPATGRPRRQHQPGLTVTTSGARLVPRPVPHRPTPAQLGSSCPSLAVAELVYVLRMVVARG